MKSLAQVHVRMKRLILFLVAIELLVIFLVGRQIYQKSQHVLGTSVSVHPIRRENLAFTLEKDLQYFYEPKPNTKQNQNVSYITRIPTQTINADSLNERFDYAIEKPEGTFRIITLGDSYTYGLLVDTKDNYPEQLEELLNNKLACANFKRFEVINLGVAGYDIQYSIERFRMRGQKYNPDLVLWFVKKDDFRDIAELLLARLQEEQEQMGESGMFSQLQEQGQYDPAWIKIVEKLVNEVGLEKLANYSKESLKTIDKYYVSSLILFSFPFLEERYKAIINDFIASHSSAHFHSSLVNIYDGKQNNFLDRHPTPKGYSEIAKDLLDYLTENSIIPCD